MEAASEMMATSLWPCMKEFFSAMLMSFLASCSSHSNYSATVHSAESLSKDAPHSESQHLVQHLLLGTGESHSHACIARHWYLTRKLYMSWCEMGFFAETAPHKWSRAEHVRAWTNKSMRGLFIPLTAAPPTARRALSSPAFPCALSFRQPGVTHSILGPMAQTARRSSLEYTNSQHWNSKHNQQCLAGQKVSSQALPGCFSMPCWAPLLLFSI